MERIIDKSIIVVGCAASLLVVELTSAFVAALLIAISVSALPEIPAMNRWVTLMLAGVFIIVAIFIPALIVCIPLIAYDCLRAPALWQKLVWAVPILVGLSSLGTIVVVYAIAWSLIATVLSIKTQRIEHERELYRVLRDQSRELSITMAKQNRELVNKQDFEVRLAMLDERARIAREIHDNVGHLLTRSVLQVNAAKVVHGSNPQLQSTFEQIGNTLSEAFDTVRTSVHDLHDDAFDLSTQLYAIERDSPINLQIDNAAKDVPEDVAYCLIAVIKEAISNTVKHSDATKVTVGIYEHPAIWQLEIKDNGSKKSLLGGSLGTLGIAKLSQNGIGLKNMAERIHSFGGVFRIDCSKGFVIFASIPKHQESMRANQ